MRGVRYEVQGLGGRGPPHLFPAHVSGTEGACRAQTAADTPVGLHVCEAPRGTK